MRSLKRAFQAVWALAALLVLPATLACGGGHSSPPPPTPPSITTQPASQTVLEGATATFSVVATGTAPLTYQWNKVVGTTSTPITTGGTSASYTTPATVLADSGSSFTVTVTNSAGNVTSSAATLTVNPAPPSISTQPVNTTVTSGATATFTVVASGSAPLSYQWSKGGTAISGATFASYTTPATTLGDNGSSFTVTVTNSVSSVTSNAAILTVQQAPVFITEPNGTTVTAGSSVTFTAAAAGNPLPAYQWYKGTTLLVGRTAATLTIASASLADAGSYTVTATNSLGSVTSNAAVLVVDQAPIIGTQPSSQTIVSGQPVTFSVTATGFPVPTYQWKKNGTAISGQTNASYTIAAVAPADAGNYTVDAINTFGTVTSNAAVLTVTVPPAITTQPVAQTVTAPAMATFTVAATGSPSPTYQWNLNGTAISGATGASYTTPATSAAMNGGRYTVTVSNGIGSPVTSTPVVLTVYFAPVITAPPASMSVTDPATATFTVAATGNPAPTYQWNLNGTAITGATNASYTTPATSLAMNGNSYTVTVSNGIGSPVTSAAAVLTVNQVVAITTQPVAQAVTAPATATFMAAATGFPTPTYQWNLNGTAISGATSASYTTPATSAAMNGGSYTVTVSNGIGSPVTSIPVVLTVNFAAAITTQPVAQTVTAPAMATFTTAATGNPAPSYQWNLNGTAITGATNASYTTPATSLAMNNGSYTVTVSNGIGSPVTSAAAVLTVNQGVAITTQPVAQTVTAPATATFTVAATGSPSPTYQWNLNGTAIAGATNASYTIPATTAAMNGGSYTVTVSNGIGSPVTSNPVVLTVNFAAAITTPPVAQTVTAPAPATFTVAATGNPAPSYQWNLNGTAISGATNANYTTPATSLTMNGYSYTVTVSNGIGSPVTSAAASLTVTNAAAITTQPVTQTVTAPATATFTVVAIGSPSPTYQWNLNGAPISGATNPSYTTPATTAAMNGGSYTVTVSNGVGSPVTSNAALLIVDYAPAITTQPVSVAVNAPATATFTVAATGNPGPTYQWNLNGVAIPGATFASYTTPATSTGMDQNSYTVTVSNGIGSPVTSSAAILSVHTGPVITAQPQSITVTAPATATFTVTATGSPSPSYQWSVNGVSIPGATNASYTTPPTTLAMEGNNYAVTLNNGVGASVTSINAQLTVNVAPVITTAPQAQTIILNSSLSLSVVASGYPTTFNYQWYLNGSPIPGATSSTYNVASAALSDGGQYYVTVSNGIGTAAQSAPVTVTVTTNHNISGNVQLANGGTGVPGAFMTLSNTATPPVIIQTLSTDSNGNFTFMNIPDGTYTLVPSFAGASASGFLPATQSLTVAGADLTNINFQALLGFTVNGHVYYSGTKTGRVYLTLNGSNGGANNGVSIVGPTGDFSIRGVPPGTYSLTAFMDTIGLGNANASDPSATGTTVTVGFAAPSGTSVNLVDPSAVVLSSAPTFSMIPFSGGAVVNYTPLVTSPTNGVETATSYDVQWSTSNTFGTLAGSANFKASFHQSEIYFTAGLTNNTTYYFRLRGNVGTTHGPWSAAASVVPNAATGYVTVSGTINLGAAPTGPLAVILVPTNKSGTPLITWFATPSQVQNYTITGVPPDTYSLIAILDQNNNGIIDPGDLSNTGSGGNNQATITVASSNLTGQNLNLSGANAVAAVTTQHYIYTSSTTTGEGYQLNYRVNGNVKLPVNVALQFGSSSFVDVGVNYSGDRFQYWLPIAQPTVGATYSVPVVYSDLAVETLLPQVTGVLAASAFARTLTPTTSGSGNVTPTFTWAAPSAPPSGTYTYQFWIWGPTGTIWQIPGNHSNVNGFPSSVLSLTWGMDPTDSTNLPNPSTLTIGNQYTWTISVQDTYGNSGQQQVSYTP